MAVEGYVYSNIENTGSFTAGNMVSGNGTANIFGNFSSSGANAVVWFYISGSQSSNMGISGDLTAGGTMQTEVVGQNNPGRNDTFHVISFCGTRTGRFGNATFTMGQNPYHLEFSGSNVEIAPTPQANNDQANVNEGASVNISVLTNDDCPYGTPAIIAINGQAVAFGTPVTLPSGASVTVNSNGTISYAPSIGSYTADSFTYTLSANAADPDSNGTSIGTVNIAVNRAPTLYSIQEQYVTQGSSASVWPMAMDANLDTLTYSLVSAPAWVSIDSSTGRVTFSPGVEINVGGYSIELKVMDPGGLFATTMFTVNVWPA